MKKSIHLLSILLPAIFFSCVLVNEDKIPVSSRLINPVTLDGQITSSEEWVETDAYAIALDRQCCWPNMQTIEDAAVITLRLKNDDLWLYMLYKIAWSPSDTDPSDLADIKQFTGPYGPPWAESDRGGGLSGGRPGIPMVGTTHNGLRILTPADRTMWKVLLLTMVLFIGLSSERGWIPATAAIGLLNLPKQLL